MKVVNSFISYALLLKKYPLNGLSNGRLKQTLHLDDVHSAQSSGAAIKVCAENFVANTLLHVTQL